MELLVIFLISCCRNSILIEGEDYRGSSERKQSWPLIEIKLLRKTLASTLIQMLALWSVQIFPDILIVLQGEGLP